MDLSFTLTPEQETWRREVAAFLEAELDPRLAGLEFAPTETDDKELADLTKAFWKKVGSRGWISRSWPREFYGQGRPTIEHWILENEFSEVGAPGQFTISDSVANILLRLGTPEQNERFLKPTAAGEAFWAEGYTEPDAGSDLASLKTRAERVGDEWVINGQKTFTSGGHFCSHIIVAARTDPDAPKHAGISYFVMPTDLPGIEFEALYNIAGGRQNNTYFDNVRVPNGWQIGELNEGWRQIWFGMGGRSLPTPPAAPPHKYRGERAVEQLMQFCRETTRNGAPLSKDPIVRRQITDMLIELEGLKMLETEFQWRRSVGEPSPYGSYLPQAVEKEMRPYLANTISEIIGPRFQLNEGDRWAPDWEPHAGRIQHDYRYWFNTHSGGSMQIKRMVLATRGLGLPR